MRLIPLAFAAALALSGCGGLSGCAGTSISQVAPKTVADAEKALTLAHLAYDGLGQALKAAATSGLLHGADAAKAKVLYDQAGDAIALADKADSVANAQGIYDAVTQANDLITQASAFAKAK